MVQRKLSEALEVFWRAQRIAKDWLLKTKPIHLCRPTSRYYAEQSVISRVLKAELTKRLAFSSKNLGLRKDSPRRIQPATTGKVFWAQLGKEFASYVAPRPLGEL